MSVVAVLAVIFGLKEMAQNGLGMIPALAILVGLVVGALWVRRQQSLADPMIDVNLFRIRSFNAALAVNYLSIFVMVGTSCSSRSSAVAISGELPAQVAHIAPTQFRAAGG